MKNNLLNCFCKIYGRVQGVGYRAWTKRSADKYSLNGWVKNCEDSTVECEVSGNRENVKSFIKDCAKGPLLASVKNIHTENRPFKNFTSFIIQVK